MDRIQSVLRQSVWRRGMNVPVFRRRHQKGEKLKKKGKPCHWKGGRRMELFFFGGPWMGVDSDPQMGVKKRKGHQGLNKRECC